MSCSLVSTFRLTNTVATSNWTGDVILKEFVMVLDTFEDRCSVPAAISNDKLEFKLDSDADVHSKTVESVGCIESESNDAEIPPADVFRIHMRDACEMDDAKKDNMDCTIFNSCCAIFPSSFNLVSCKKIDGSTPFITFDSSYFGRYSGQEILQLFDGLTESKFNRRFLFEIDTDGEINHKLWLTRLEAVINDGRVPLYAIMLARLEQAICDSFKRMLFERELVLTRPSIEFPFPLLSSKPEALSDDSKVDNFLFSELPSILNDVFNHARAIDNLTLAMDSSTLLSFMEPFTNAFKLTVDDPACCLPRYLASTPLYLILSAARNNNELNFSALNDSVKSSLQRIQDHGSEPKYIQAENDNETIKCFDSNTQSQEDNLDCVKQSCCDDISTEDIENSNSYEDTVEILQQTNHSKSSKRKKKKNKRRKVRFLKFLFILSMLL